MPESKAQVLTDSQGDERGASTDCLQYPSTFLLPPAEDYAQSLLILSMFNGSLGGFARKVHLGTIHLKTSFVGYVSKTWKHPQTTQE